MTKQEYIATLLKLYRVANLSDADPDDTPERPDWLKGDESYTHCGLHFDPILRDLGYDGNFEELM